MPDAGLISFAELLDQMRSICSALPGIPVMADADTGFGNAMNVRRAVKEYARAGVSCIMLEDQVAPKRCGHFDGKEVISAAEARMKIRAAVEAAREADIMILARTDARGPLGMEEAIARCLAFQEEGADLVFLEAPESTDELRRFVQSMRAPTVANMVEGGRTPVISPRELSEIGVRLAFYHPMLGPAITAMQTSSAALRAGDYRAPAAGASLGEMKRVVGYPEHDELERRYATPEAGE